jgi:hypothetical protein
MRRELPVFEGECPELDAPRKHYYRVGDRGKLRIAEQGELIKRSEEYQAKLQEF